MQETNNSDETAGWFLNVFRAIKTGGYSVQCVHVDLTFYFSRKSQTDLHVLSQQGSASYSRSYSYIHRWELHSTNALSYRRPLSISAGPTDPNQKSAAATVH